MDVTASLPIAIRIVVTPGPPPRYNYAVQPIGAIGWLITWPMRPRFHNVSERCRRAPELAVLFRCSSSLLTLRGLRFESGVTQRADRANLWITLYRATFH